MAIKKLNLTTFARPFAWFVMLGGLSSLAVSDVNVLRTGVYASKPYSWVDDNGDYRGAAVTKLRALVDHIYPDAEVDYTRATSLRLTQDLLKGRYDLLIAFDHPDLERDAINLGAMTDIDIVYWMLKDRAENIGADNSELLIGMTPTHRELVSKDQPILEVNTSKSLIQMLMAGRVDAIIATEPGLCYLSKAQGLSLDNFERRTISQKTSYLWAPKEGVVASNAQAWKNSIQAFKQSPLADEMENYCEWVIGLLDQ